MSFELQLKRKEKRSEKGIPEKRNGMCKGQEVRETTVHLEPPSVVCMAACAWEGDGTQSQKSG